jgi:hypothetical protein
MAGKPKARGRPAKAAIEGARNSLGLRVTADLKKRLEERAAASGRSQSQEAEFRLEQSFRQDDEELEVWGERGAREAWRICAAAANTLVAKSGRHWLVDPETHQHVQRAVKVILDVVGPEGPEFEGPHDAEGAEAAVLEIANLLKVRHGMDLFDPDVLERLKRRELSEAAGRIEQIS